MSKYDIYHSVFDDFKEFVEMLEGGQVTMKMNFTARRRREMIMYYKRDGTPYESTPEDPYGMKAWAESIDNHDRRVARTKVPGGLVSTVFVGMNHQFGDGPPLIFESMFFGNDGEPEEEDQERYSTEAEALAGHARMVKKYSGISHWVRAVWAKIRRSTCHPRNSS